MGSSPSTDTHSTTAQTNSPWDPAIGGLNTIIGKVGTDILPNTGATTAENTAFSRLSDNANAGNPYASAIGKTATDFLAGGPDRTGYVTGAYGDYIKNLQPTIAGDYMDPNKNPFFNATTTGIGNDVRDRVNGMFAGAGRDLSGMNTQTLARGIAQGTAPVYAGVYNNERTNQLGAMDKAYGAGVNTGTTLTGLDQASLGTRAAGIPMANAALDANNDPYTRALAIAQAQRNLPVQNIGAAASLLAPIAALGGQSQGTGDTHTQQNVPLWMQILGGAQMGASTLSKFGMFGAGGGA